MFVFIPKRPGTRRAVKVDAKNKGISRDILAEAGTGHDTVVMGRRGLPGIKEFIMGSVPQKVLHSVKDGSIGIVSGRVGFGVLCIFEEVF